MDSQLEDFSQMCTLVGGLLLHCSIRHKAIPDIACKALEARFNLAPPSAARSFYLAMHAAGDALVHVDPLAFGGPRPVQLAPAEAHACLIFSLLAFGCGLESLL